MWPEKFLLLASFGIVVSELIGGGFDRTMSEGLTSLGYKIVYGEEEMMKINEVVSATDKKQKSKININQAAPPLPVQDVRCLMSSDNYCTKNMYSIKRILLQSIKNDCAKCTAKEKQKAGKVVASLMAHDPAAWKSFLNRYALLTLAKDTTPRQQEKELRLRPIGPPQEIKDSESRVLASGASVRVKRYAMEEY